jgi:hypothetical protein
MNANVKPKYIELRFLIAAMVSCFEWELEIHEAVVALPLLGQLVVRGW